MKAVAVLALAGLASVASAQAVQSFTGGSQFAIFFGGSTGDVVGYRFSVNSPITVTDLGVWNADTNTGGAGLSSDHMVGIWENSTQSLLTFATVSPVGSTVIGQWNYVPTDPVVLVPGVMYTAGAMYTATDNDSYISSPSSVMAAPEVNIINGVNPSAGNLGFVYPTTTSTNIARFGPNFLFVPTPGAAALIGLGGLLAARRRR